MEKIEMSDPVETRPLHVGSEDDGCSNRGRVTDSVSKSRSCKLSYAHCSIKREEKNQSQPDDEPICNAVSRGDGKKTPDITDQLCGKRMGKRRSCDDGNKQTPVSPRRSLRSNSSGEVPCSHPAPSNRLRATPATSRASAKQKTTAVPTDICRQSRKVAGNTAICQDKSHCAQKKSLVTYPGKRQSTCDSASDHTSGLPRSVDPWTEACTLDAGGSGSQPAYKKIRAVVGKMPWSSTVHDMVDGLCGPELHDTTAQCKKSQPLRRAVAKNCRDKGLKRKRKGLLQRVSWRLQECKRCRKKCTITVIKSRRQQRPPGAWRWSVRPCPSGQSKTCAQCKKSMQDRRPASGEKAYSCPECGKRFLQPALLDLHQKSHAEEKLLVCPLCGKRFVQQALLLLHQKAHRVNKPYQCMDCGNLFFSKALFTEHLRTHREEKPFRCFDCGKSFADNTTLVIHQRIHTGEKPFSCEKCGRCFSQPSTLVSHQRIHSGEKPYECHVCGKRFRDRSSAACHQRIHKGEKPFKCQECGKSFTQSCNLRRHERLHTGEKPFICSKCGKAFNESSKLKSHDNVHLKKERREAQQKRK